jgi:hypothetical protein
MPGTPMESVFKFVSVRPPQPVAETALPDVVIPYDGPFYDGSLIERVIQRTDWESAKALAEQAILQAPAVLDFQDLAHSSGFAAFRAALGRGLPANMTTADVERLLGGSLGAAVGQKPYPSAKARILDIYAAHSLLPGNLPEQREKALLSLRTLHLLQALDHDPAVLGDHRRLRRVSRARVILPGAFLQKKSIGRGATPRAQSADAPVPPPPPSGTPGFHAAGFERLRDLYAVRRELRTARRRNRQERTVRRSPRPSTGSAEQAAEDGVASSSPAPSPRVLLPAVAETISGRTLGFLTGEGVPTDRLNVDDGLRAVDARIRASRTRFFEGVPTPVMVTVDRLADPGELGTDVQELPSGLFGTTVSTGPVGTTPQEGVGPVRPLGIGELLVVEQTLQRYEAGEISYVENVLQTEHLSRSFRSLNRTEQTVFTATSTTEQSEHDLQATDRFELSTQAQKTIAQDQSVQAGVTVSASYGPVKVGAYGDFATSTSTTESTSSATTFAQDVTERSVSTITTQVREEQTTRILQEFEERSEHGFDNTHGTANVAGIYQWLDKKYRAQIYDYGQRLMFEFLIPAPASYHLHALANQPKAGVSLSEPEPLGDLRPADLNATNYQDYVARYAVAGASPPPPETTVLSTVFEQTGLNATTLVSKSNAALQVPAGYRAVSGRFVDYHAWKGGGGHYLIVLIGTQQLDSASGENADVALDGEDTVVPVGVFALVWGYLVTIEMECELTDTAFGQWQQETYDAVAAAYQAQKSAYDAQVSGAGFTVGSTTYGGSENENLRIQLEELKKGSLTMLARQYFEDFDAMSLTGTASGLPEFDVDEAASEGAYAQFFEQAFEWGQMTYLYYPYFWMNKPGWLERSALVSGDALFGEFLRAGYARVVVPVTPAYDDAVLFFLSSGGRIWNGGEPPTIDDPLYVSIAAELADATEGRTAYGEPWDVTIPTTLVYLKSDSTLPDWTTGAP